MEQISLHDFYQLCYFGNLDEVTNILNTDVYQDGYKQLENNKKCSSQHLTEGLLGACHGGQKAVVEYLLSKGADDEYNLSLGLRNACYGGHKELVDLMILKGVANGPKSPGDEVKDFNRGLWGACEGGHLELAKLMVSKGANNFNEGLKSASCNGHKEIVELMLKCGATNLDKGIEYSFGKHDEVLKLLIREKNKRDVAITV